MDLAYFKRYRMEISLTGRDFTPSLPAGYRFLGWQPSLLDAFAEAKYLSFRGEIDTNVFPCLGERAGCRRLMNEISQKPGFLAEATWLVEHVGEAGEESPYCGTIQGIRDHAGLGAIQNVGVTPAHRNGGVGTALLRQAMQGFQRAGMSRVYLEVTAENVAAIRLYRRFGFVTVKTVFKAVEAAYL
ncbi:MAG: GNAT family N-acetyltransferase [Thermoguttaceae bacterium]